MKKQTLAALLFAVILALAGCSNESTNLPEEAGSTEEQGLQTEVSNENETEDDTEQRTVEELYAQAVQDSVFAEESEVQPLVTLTQDNEYVSWDEQGRVLLCTWHNFPDSYPEGEMVTVEWGPVWTFTDKEMATYGEELKEAEDPEMRLKQIIAFAPDSEHSTVTGFWVYPSDVRRPAYQSDPTDGSMATIFAEDVDEEFNAWFDKNILNSYFYGSYPWTRLGYTYDWADNGTEYGVTEFIVNNGAQVEVEFTETTEEFLTRLEESVQ